MVCKRLLLVVFDLGIRKICQEFGSSSCVFRVSMQEPAESTGNFKLREIMNELSTLFTDAIEQVGVILDFSFYICFYLNTQKFSYDIFLMFRIFSF